MTTKERRSTQENYSGTFRQLPAGTTEEERVIACFQAIPNIPLGQLSEDQPLPTREERRVIAKRGLLAAYPEAADEPRQSMTDMLADLRHVCDALGISFSELDECANDHYLEELGTRGVI